MVKDNLELCRQRVSQVAVKVHAQAQDIVLVAVTKGVALEPMYEAIDAGVEHIGESKIQEALSKYPYVCDYAQKKGKHLFWHMIGHLQSNKVKEAVKIFDLIQSVDSIRLASEIDKQALKIGKIQDILLEVNVAQEATKYGFKPDEIVAAAADMAVLKNIRIKGLMTIAPAVDDPEDARPYFRKLKELSNKIFVPRPSSLVPRVILSMGMTDDFIQAIAEGSNMVRIGRGLFARPDNMSGRGSAKLI